MSTDISTDLSHLNNAPSALTEDAMMEVTSFEDALAILNASGVVAESISDFGAGFTVVDKARLLNVPFVILEWRFNSSELNDAGFVSLSVVTKNGDKWIINDGSTGILQQLIRVTRVRRQRKHATPQNGLAVPAGLSVSNYKFTDAEGKERPASTFYLNESPTPVL